jgi:ribosomal protein S12 methylthiotransferase accessory factor
MSDWRPETLKAKSPLNTIKTIRDILFANDIFVLEESWFNHNTMNPFNSVGVAMPGTNLTTAGKGRDEQYALASGYAEWMERLQTLLLIRANFFVGNQSIKAASFPDGTPLIYEDYVGEHEEVLKSLFNSSDIRELDFLSECSRNMALYPFYEVISNSVQGLPLELISIFCGSNGLCSGNTPAEAIIQGMCEIFERFILKEIFTNKDISLPTIPNGLLEMTPIQSYIKVLNSMGIDVKIKDCSLNGKFPVVGVVIQKDGKALFNLGSSPDYVVAIERCFTEMFQGWDAHSIESKMVPILKNRDELPDKWIKSESHEELLQYYKQIKKGDGRVPLTMLDENKIFNKEHLFRSKDCFETNTLISLIEKAKSISSKIFIRDVSFLGFPTYQIYIPGITEIKSTSSKMSIEQFLLTSIDIPRSRQCLFNINNNGNDEIHNLTKTLERMLQEPFIEDSNILKTIHNLSLKENIELNNLHPENLLVILYCKTKQFHKAHGVMERYLSKILSVDQLQFPPDFALEHVCLMRVLEALKEGATLLNIPGKLSPKFPRQIIKDTCEFLLDIDVQEFLGIPHCEDCSTCTYKDICACEDIVNFSKKIQEKVNAYPFNQHLLADIFYKNHTFN